MPLLASFWCQPPTYPINDGKGNERQKGTWWHACMLQKIYFCDLLNFCGTIYLWRSRSMDRRCLIFKRTWNWWENDPRTIILLGNILDLRHCSHTPNLQLPASLKIIYNLNIWENISFSYLLRQKLDSHLKLSIKYRPGLIIKLIPHTLVGMGRWGWFYAYKFDRIHLMLNMRYFNSNVK